MVSGLVHFYSCIHGLEERFLVDAGKDEASLVKRFRALGGGADADGGERTTDGGKEATFLRKCSGIRHHGKSIHL